MKKIILGSMMTALFAFAGIQTASAVAPANSTITNTASLSYTGLVTPITASVDVTVLLVPAAATVIAPTAVTVAEGQTATLTYQIRANANGPDAYTFNVPTSVATNVTGSSAPTTPAGITLGATAAAASAAIGATTITVPADGTANNSLNGIIAGDSIVIGGNVYVVAAITDTATGNQTITLTTPLTTAVLLGDQIGEQQSFTVSMTAGVVTPPATAGTEVISVVSNGSGVGTASAPVAGTVNVVKVVFIKSVSVNGGAFLTTLQNVKSGDTLTYRMIAQVPANSTLNGATFTDTIPPFMTYVLNSTTLDVDGPAGVTAPTAAADVAGTTPLVGGLQVNSLGQAAGVVAGGAAGTEVSVDFQVTVD